MENTSTINLTFYLKKYWFQLSLVTIVLYVILSKDLSFQFNINNPDIENSIELPNNVQQPGKKEKELFTQKSSNPEVVKSEAGFFSSIPFIGSGSSSAKKKSELPQIEAFVIDSYLKRFANVAISERKKYGVPASIILANALFHSYAGKRDMAQSGNNHFAIPCTTDWNGPNDTYTGMCYRHYENAWTSFRDHSLFVTSGKYAKLRQLGSTDYKGWAKNLEAEG
ncbi:MAG: flagellum-specific peptidoglycan hydrolase FlgJ, partial [Saprospiraceae bacterium]